MDGPDGQGTVGRVLSVLGSGVTVAGALLPWIEVNAIVTSLTRSGLDREGWLTIALALAVVGIVTLRPWDRLDGIAVIACGAVIFGVGAGYVADLSLGIQVVPASGLVEEVGREFADPGIGTYVTAAGGLLVLAGGIVGRLARRHRG